MILLHQLQLIKTLLLLLQKSYSFVAGSLNLTSQIIVTNPSFDVNNSTLTEANNNFNINQIINYFYLNVSTRISPIIDIIPTFEAMTITINSPVIGTIPSFYTEVTTYNIKIYENKIEITTNLTSTQINDQITDLNFIGYKTSIPTFDAGLT